MTARVAPQLRYLTAADVVAAMPPLAERLRLAELTMTALVHDAELPPKIGVHPRPEGSFAHAMPAHLRGVDPEGADDLLGLKWIAGFPANRAQDLAAIHGLVLLTDPTTGVPTAILDAAPITAERTAAISGVAIARYAPNVVGRRPRVALLGAGVQARSHLEVLGHVLPGLELALFDRHPERATALATIARETPGIGSAVTAGDARDATRSADVVVTVASFAPPHERQRLTDDWLMPDALVVAVDSTGNFDDYPDPAATIGEALLDGRMRPSGRVVVSHLGVGLADLVFANAIVGRAAADGIGTMLAR
ncbi:MAG: hypothetical protein E6J91_15635 [Deltaproteobacteria bacterium]|nr:MAG: hypothetical protein E6J91_15635 [Deltaproteobacteria bacterium]